VVQNKSKKIKDMQCSLSYQAKSNQDESLGFVATTSACQSLLAD
jgi:hypothetical protein